MDQQLFNPDEIIIPKGLPDAKYLIKKFHALSKKNGGYALDTETTGLLWTVDKLLMISLYTPGMAIVLPLAWPNVNLSVANVKEMLDPLARDKKLRAYLHNAKFDMHFLYNHGVYLENEIHDTCVAGFDLDVTKSAKLKIRAKEELALEMTEFKEKFKLGGKHKLTLLDYPAAEVGKYAALDVFATYSLADKFLVPVVESDPYYKSVRLNHVDEDLPMLYDRIDSGIVPVLWDMERAGIRVDVPKLTAAKAEYTDALAGLEKSIQTEAGVAFNMNSPKQVTQVFSRRGIALDSTDEKHLEKYARRGEKLAKLMLEYRKKTKVLSTYITTMLENRDAQDRVHTSFNLHIAATGRLCVARGTCVDAVRDVSKFPKGIPVERVAAGDLVYTYDDDLKLTIRKVLWAGKTGTKRVVRLKYWDGNYSEVMSLDLTPDHPVRLFGGTYKKAGELAKGDRVMALSRYTNPDGYSKLIITGTRHQPKEHRFIAKTLGMSGGDPRSQQIHHKDGNKLNNTVENLEVMGVAEHAKMHWEKTPAATKRRISEEASIRTSRLIREGVIPRGSFKCGAENPNYRKVTKVGLLRDLAQTKGKTTQTKMDDNVISLKCRELGFTTMDVRVRYDKFGVLIPRHRLHFIATTVSNLGAMSRLLNTHVYNMKALLTRYGYPIPKPTKNHIIISVEPVETEVDVFDIEVEDTHNFIANELCVHNSSSAPVNLQNQPRDRWWREMFIASPGHKLIVRDFSQIELRVLAVVSEDPVLLDEYKHGADVHMNNGIQIAKTLGFDPKKLSKEELKKFRTQAKSSLSFGGLH